MRARSDLIPPSNRLNDCRSPSPRLGKIWPGLTKCACAFQIALPNGVFPIFSLDHAFGSAPPTKQGLNYSYIAPPSGEMQRRTATLIPCIRVSPTSNQSVDRSKIFLPGSFVKGQRVSGDTRAYQAQNDSRK